MIYSLFTYIIIITLITDFYNEIYADKGEKYVSKYGIGTENNG